MLMQHVCGLVLDCYKYSVETIVAVFHRHRMERRTVFQRIFLPFYISIAWRLDGNLQQSAIALFIVKPTHPHSHHRHPALHFSSREEGIQASRRGLESEWVIKLCNKTCSVHSETLEKVHHLVTRKPRARSTTRQLPIGKAAHCFLYRKCLSRLLFSISMVLFFCFWKNQFTFLGIECACAYLHILFKIN